MATVPSAGRESGSTTVRRKRNDEAPSILAASQSSRGIWRNACLSRNVPNAVARNGTARP